MNLEKINEKLEKDIRNLKSYPTNLVGRGRDSATKYFKIPKKLRKGITKNRKALVRRITKKNTVMFIFEIRR